jgi:ribosomal protein S18 acetylase RimI-like enzyme
MKIVPATVENAPGIAGVHVRSWQAAYAGILDAEFLQGISIDSRAQQWQGNLQRNESQTLVAQRGDSVLGFVSYGRCRDKDAPADRGEIWALYADPAAWGQGVGLALMRSAVAGLQALGHTSTSLWVLGQNQRGIRFYQAFGFTPVPGSAKHFELGGRQVEEVCLLMQHECPPEATIE